MATESDNVNSGALGTLLAVGTIATLGIALVVTALVRAELAEETDKKEVGADRPYRDLIAEQTAKMAAPAAYVDRGRGLVSLPIDRAMELTVSGLIKDPNSATPPAPIGGSGGTGGGGTGGGDAVGGGSAEMGGTSGAGGSGGTRAAGDAKPAEGQAKPAEAVAPVPSEGKKDEKKKDGPKPKPAAPVPATPAAPVPAAPVPPAPVPAPAAPAPAPNGQ